MTQYRLYIITAQVLTESGEYSGSRQVPTFYLDAALQGITDAEHAKDIAKHVIDPTGRLTLVIQAELMDRAFTPPF